MPTQQRKAVYGLIRGLVGQANSIAIPRLFVKLAGGSYEQAAFLAQCVFWSDYAEDDGWFFKTYDQWYDELALSEYHIRQATAAWVERGALATKRKMVAGRPLVHYRVDFEALEAALLALAGPDYEKIAESDPANSSPSEPEKIAGSIGIRIQESESSLSPDGEREADARPPLTGPSPLLGSRIEDWPEGLTPSHVKALIAAGYNPGTVKDATVLDLLRIDGIGEKAVKIITGVDLAKTRLDVPPAVRGAVGDPFPASAPLVAQDRRGGRRRAGRRTHERPVPALGGPRLQPAQLRWVAPGLVRQWRARQWCAPTPPAPHTKGPDRPWRNEHARWSRRARF
jgi:hypothetical protein